MANYLSPEVKTVEIDNSLTAAEVSTTIGASVLAAAWGPVLTPTLIDSETTLVNVFAKPNNNNYKEWFTASNFLSYSNALYVIRMQTEKQYNANAFGKTGEQQAKVTKSQATKTIPEGTPIVDSGGNPVMERVGLVINNEDQYINEYANGNDDFGQFAARYPGSIGNSLLVTYADANTFKDQYGHSLWTWIDSSGNYHDWTQEFSSAPGTSNYAAAHNSKNDEIHLLVVDAGGRISGTKGTILEKYEFLSKASDAQGLDGTNIYYKEVLKDQSEYVYCLDLPRETEESKDKPAELISSADATISLVVSKEGSVDVSKLKPGDLVLDITPVNSKASARLFTVFSQTDYELLNGKAKEVTKSVISEESGHMVDITSHIGDVNYTFLDLTDTNNLTKDKRKVLTVSSSDPTGVSLTVSGKQAKGFGHVALDTEFLSLKTSYSVQMSGGADDYDYTDAEAMKAYDRISNKETYDISLIPVGPASQTVAKYVIQNICETRGDCVAFVSPSDGRGPILGSITNEDIKGGVTDSEIKILNKTLLWRTQAKFNVSSSYGHLDSGWKYQYDKYNDCNRWVPLNGDCAGIYARTDDTNAPWWSGAGYNRGQVKNVIKLSYNPPKAHRDQLYQQNINPVVTFNGEGTVLYGDKTLLTKPSAFNRMNVRRLFIYLEKTLSNVSKYLLFEFNDAITRSYAVNICEPVLKNTMGGRGIYSYKIVCDTTNNTPDIINANRMVVDIMVSPSRSINYITLQFTCEKTGASVFSESEI